MWLLPLVLGGCLMSGSLSGIAIFYWYRWKKPDGKEIRTIFKLLLGAIVGVGAILLVGGLILE